MKMQKMLHVKWSETDSATYYVDVNSYSVAHDNGNGIISLEAFSGNYQFDTTTKAVRLFDGVKMRDVEVKSWKVYDTPTP